MLSLKNSCWLIAILFLASCNSEKDFKPESHLSLVEQDKVMITVIRYIGKAPENVSNAEKFDKKYDTHYQELAGRHHFELYYVADDGTHYFLISRPAPSLFEKRVAIGGKMKFSSDWQLSEYEEVFRTWKMKEDELRKKSAILFGLMVDNQSLIPYQAPLATEEYIEFPDPRTFYDKASRTWKVK